VTPPPSDPVRAKRERIARWTLLANRVGYLFIALAIALFLAAFMLGWSTLLAGLITAALVIGSVLLAPSIVLGYAVKAAEKEDRARGL
jgi:small-conductance mechanosensitive channel